MDLKCFKRIIAKELAVAVCVSALGIPGFEGSVQVMAEENILSELDVYEETSHGGNYELPIDPARPTATATSTATSTATATATQAAATSTATATVQPGIPTGTQGQPTATATVIPNLPTGTQAAPTGTTSPEAPTGTPEPSMTTATSSPTATATVTPNLPTGTPGEATATSTAAPTIPGQEIRYIVSAQKLDAKSLMPKAVNAEKIKFRSSDKKIAAVNGKGIVTGKKKSGNVTITAYTKKGKQETIIDRCSITVICPELVKTISIEKQKSVELSAYLKNIEAFETAGIIPSGFVSSKSEILTVDEKGNLQALIPGKAKVSYNINGVTLKLIVKVPKI